MLMRRRDVGEKDAQAYPNKALREKDLGTFVEPSRVTSGTCLEKWLEEVARPRLRPKTYESYAWLIRKYALPTLGSRNLSALSPIEIQSLYNTL